MSYRLASILVGWTLVGTTCVAYGDERQADSSVTADRMAARINELLAESWQTAGLRPTTAATDAEFLRRAHLDLTGRIPRVSQVREYLDDTSSNRRPRLIDSLLAKPAHVTHIATTWQRILLPSGADIDQFDGMTAFTSWLRDRFARNVAYDEIVRELLLAEGLIGQSGPLQFYTALDLKPEKLAARTSQLFLGVQIECAQCHDHPFEKWSQRDFWGYAAFFARVSRQQSQRREFMLVVDDAAGEVHIPESEDVVAPRFLAGDLATESDGPTRRQQLAAWLTSSENEYFARATVNRVWSHLFGRLLVDARGDEVRRYPGGDTLLLDELAAYFVDTGFDFRQLLRTLARTHAYQLASGIEPGESADSDRIVRMATKSLTAEQLFDCLSVATYRPQSAPDIAAALGDSRSGDRDRRTFVAQFRAPAGNVMEYQAGIPQALTLMNGRLIKNAAGLETSGILMSLEAPFFSENDRLDVLFLATLSRFPDEDARGTFLNYLTARETKDAKRQALSDILWALLNCAEFVHNH
jgi:hypothetical protein